MKRLPESTNRPRRGEIMRLSRVVPTVVALCLFCASVAIPAGIIVGPADDPYVVDSLTGEIPSAALVFEKVSALTNPVASLSIGQIDPSLFPRICTYVDVLDAGGVPVGGLPADSFCVSQDGSPLSGFTVQELTSDSCRTATCLVIDVSGSMADGGKLTAAKDAAKQFVRSMNIYDRTAIVKFSDCYTVVRDYTSDTTTLINAINGLTTGGMTAYFDGVWKGVGLTTTELGSKAVIALTDGMENNSRNCGNKNTTPDGLDDGFADDSAMIVNLALGAGIPIYNITLGSSFDPQYSIKLSNATGGAHYHAPTGAQLDSIYDAIKFRLCSRYLICYNSPDTVQNGDCHNVIICHRNGNGTCSPCDTGSYCEKAPPVIQRTPATIALDNTCQKANTNVQLCAWVTDKDTPLASLTVTLFYRNSGASPYTSIATTRTDSTFCATVPASQLLCTGDSIQYYFTASDGERTVASPSTAPLGHHAFPICPTNVSAGPDKAISCTVTQVNLSGSSTTPGVTFSWTALSGGNIVSGATTATPLVNAAGMYVLTVTDPSNGCSPKDTALVTANVAPPNADAGPGKVLTCTVLQVNLSGSSSTPGATFSWVATNGGNIVSGATTATPLVNAAGTYTLAVTNPANGCAASDVALVTLDVAAPNASAGADKVLTCTVTQINLSGSSSTPGATFAWVASLGGQIVSGANTATPLVNAAGTYTLTVTNPANGCTASDVALVTQDIAPPNANAGPDKVLNCTVLQVNLSGSSSTPGATFSWVASAGGNIVSGANTATPLVNAAGTYTLTVTNPANGCTASDVALVTRDIAPPNANAGPDKVLTCTVTQINLSGSSSTPGATFAWVASNGGNIVSGANTATPLVNAAGTYTLTVTNPANGCTASDVALVTQDIAPPNANAGPDKVLNCTVLQVNLSGSSSTPGATFSWVASAGGNIVSGANTATPLVNAAGTYTLTVTNPANSCTATDVALVASDVTPPNANAGPDKILNCTVTQINLSGSSSTPGATFAWVASSGGNIVSGANTATPLVNAAGTYTLTVTNPANGCTASDVALVTSDVTPPNANAGPDKVLTCTVTQINLSGSSSTPGATFSWVASGGGNIVSGATTATPLVNAAGTYTLTVTNPANGCTATDVALVTSDVTPPNANAGPDKVLTCTVTQINLSGSSSTPGATFSWVASGGGNIVSGANTATPLVDAAGTYTLTVTDPANGCTASDVALVTQNTAAPNANAGPDKVLTCAVTQINLSGSSTTPGATFSWVASAGGNIVSGAATATPLVNAAGTYTLTVTNPANGCTASDVALVTQNIAAPNANAGSDKVLTCTVTQLNLSGSSSTPGATFSWIASLGGNIVSGASTATPLVDAAGTYTLTVTDPANGCIASDVALVTQNIAAPNANAGSDKVLTCTVTQLNLSGSSSTPGATFSWIASLSGNIVSGASTATPLVDAAGTYTLTVTDLVNGCTASDVALVTQDITKPVLNCTGDELTCDSLIASATVTSSPSTGVSYLWSPAPVSGQGTASARYDTPGNKKVVVTIITTGCKDSCEATITLNANSTDASAGADKILTCVVTQITLDGSSTTPGALFSWVASNGGNIVSGASTATPLVDAAGTYTLTVTNPDNGCKVSDEALVTLNITKPNVNAGPDKVLTCTTTQVNLSGSSSTIGATFAWAASNGGHIVSGATTATPLVDAVGTYVLTVTDPANGCTAADTAMVTQNVTAPNADAGPDKVLTCAATQLNLSGSSSTPGATFSWVASAGGNIVSGANTATPLVDAVGTYTLTVTDPANGCTATDITLVTQNVTAPNANAGPDKVLTCAATQVNLSGSSSTPGATFAWVASVGGNIVSGANTATPLVDAAGTYTLTVTDPANGCTASDVALVTQNVTAPNANAGPDKVLTCAVTQINLSGSSSTPGATFSWVASAGGNIVSGANSATPLVDAAGTYTLTVTDPVNGCTASDVALVTQNVTAPNADAGLDKVLTCTVTQVNLSGSSSTPGATFSWVASNGGNIVSGANTATPLVNAAGTYTLTVTNPANGCTATDVALVTSNVAAPNADAGLDKVLTCTVTQINLSGSSSTPGATFSWVASNGGTIVSGATTATPLVNAAGTYTLTVTDPANGCTATDVALVISDVTPPNANAGPDKVLTCTVTQINLSGSSSTPGATFSWVASAGGNIVSGANTATPLVDAAGTYTLTVTNPANGCTASDVALVTQNVAAPNANAGPDKVLTCAVTQVNLSGSSSTPGATFSWVASAGGNIVSGANTATPLVDAAGTYTLTVTDPANGCTATDIALVTQNVTAPNANAGLDKVLTCAVTQINLSGSSSTPGATFSWVASAGGNIVSGANTATPLVDAAGTYTLTVTDPANGCTASDVALVTQNVTAPNANAGADKVLTCVVTQVNLSGSSTTPGATFSWVASAGGNIVSGANTATPLVDAAGTYTLTVTDPANGCTASDIALVTQDITKPVLSCSGDELTCDSLLASATVASTPSTGVSYVWTPAPVSGQGTASARYDTPGTKKVVVTILASGCKDSCEAVITQNINGANANAGPDKILTCLITQINLSGSSSTPGAIYSWVASSGGNIVSGASTATPLVNAAGTYTLTVTNPANGCKASDAAFVNVIPNGPPTISFGPDLTVTECSQAQVCVPYIVSDPDGLSGVVESLVSGPPGATIDSAGNRVCFTPANPGTYTVVARVTDPCGASDYDTINVIIQCQIPPVLHKPRLVFNYLCSGLDTICTPLVITHPANDPICSVTASGFEGLVSIDSTQICLASDEATCDTVTIIVTTCSGLADTVDAEIDGSCSSCGSSLISVSVGGPDAPGPVSSKLKSHQATPAGMIQAISGKTVTIPIMIDRLRLDADSIGGFDLLLCYDASGIRLVNVERGTAISHWDYFTYRFGVNGNCDGPCPPGAVHLIGIADLDNGPSVHPPLAEFHPVGPIAQLSFQVSTDRNYIGQCLAINFCSFDCTDNMISSKSGDTAFVEIDGIKSSCLSNPKFPLVQGICFSGGLICIIPPPDDRGDINLNGVADEVADAVLFSNYFIYGIDEFSSDDALRQVQILATDVNDDGIVLTVADLVYLVRILTGDATPFPAWPKLAASGTAHITADITSDRMTIAWDSPVPVGGARFAIDLPVGVDLGTPQLGASATGMTLKTYRDGNQLRVLVFSLTGKSVAAGQRTVVTIPMRNADGAVISEYELASADGAVLDADLNRITAAVPREFILAQNYPNPFNAGTVIQFATPEATDYKLSIYDILGRTVWSMASHTEAGWVDIAWDGRTSDGGNLASGIYLYRVETSTHSMAKKMTLIK